MTTNNFKFNARTIDRCDLRKKFVKLLSEENTIFVLGALRKAINMKPGDAITLLAKLTYSEETAKEVYDELGLTDFFLENVFPLSERLALRDEICHQYRRHCEWFVRLRKDQLSEAGKAAYDALEKASDAVSAFVILRTCERAKYKSPEQYNATLWHLEQKNDEKILTGLRFLERSEAAKNFMLPYAAKIHDLYKILCEEYTVECEAKRAAAERAKKSAENGADEAGKNCPMADLSTKLKEKGYIIPEASQPEVCVPENVSAKPAEPQKFSEIVLANKELFNQFIEGTDLNILVTIATKFHLDPNQLMASKQDIETLLAKSVAIDILAEELASIEETFNALKTRILVAQASLSKAADVLDA